MRDMSRDITLNIDPYGPQSLWDRLAELYAEMPGWMGFHQGIPHWYSLDGQTEDRLLWASVEPGGLQIAGRLPQEEWDAWIAEFRRRASALLGYPVGAPEDGFPFPE